MQSPLRDSLHKKEASICCCPLPWHPLPSYFYLWHAESLETYYKIGKKLGQGQFGVTFLCTDKATGKEYACKTIAKKKLLTMEDVEDVKREVAIMHHLAGRGAVCWQWQWQDT